ncbi:MAG: hypothetical protein IKV03_05805 [Alphaproteobacteria bacterium]|nr:hypothetical protein [Alphaproteobacteria bacterium]
MSLKTLIRQLTAISFAVATFATTSEVEAKPKSKAKITQTKSTLPMNKEEVIEFMKTETYKNWREKLGKSWLLGVSGISEGFCPWAYICSKGVLTIGHGIATTNGMDFSRFPLYYENGEKMTPEQVSAYLSTVKTKSPKSFEAAKQLGKSMGIAGMKYKDSISIALTEVRDVIDTIYRRAYIEKGIDLMKEPRGVQILSVDIGYQVGQDNFINKWHNFLKAVKNKKYSLLSKQVSTKERADGKRNVKRHKTKLLLTQLATAQANNDNITIQNVVNELYMVGANIYNLKYRSGPPRSMPGFKLKKRETGGYPEELQKMFNIDKDGKPIVKEKPKAKNTKKGSSKKRRSLSSNRRRNRGR